MKMTFNRPKNDAIFDAIAKELREIFYNQSEREFEESVHYVYATIGRNREAIAQKAA